jgi:hypothetical protein
MSRFCLVKYFHKSIHMLVFNNYFCKNRKSKLHFGDCVAVLNAFLYQTGGSIGCDWLPARSLVPPCDW